MSDQITVTPIGVVRRRTRITVRGLDALDGSPVLDVKAYVSELAPRGEVRQPEWMHELMRHYY